MLSCPRINSLLFCHSRHAPPASRTLLLSLRLFRVTKVTLLLRLRNVDQSDMTIRLLLNLKLSRIAGQIASRMKYLRNAGKFAECGTITQNAWQVATLPSADRSSPIPGAPQVSVRSWLTHSWQCILYDYKHQINSKLSMFFFFHSRTLNKTISHPTRFRRIIFRILHSNNITRLVIRCCMGRFSRNQINLRVLSIFFVHS